MINKQYTFMYACSKNCAKTARSYRLKYVGPLLGILVGIFLLPQIAYLSEITSENILELTNVERQKENLNKLTANHLLTKAAYDKGQDIINANTFQHSINNKSFSEWIKDAGYKYSYVGENLAIDFVTSEGTIKAWLESITHKQNILNPLYKETGVAVINNKFNDSYTTVIVQIFGTPPIIINDNENTGNNSFQINKISMNSDPLNMQPENLLTHSIALENNNLITSLQDSGPFSVTHSGQIHKNTFFEQHNFYNFSLLKFSIYFICLSILFIISYIYYLTFLHITKMI